MATNWTQVRNSAIAAAQEVLGTAWSAAENGATAQIRALVEIAKYIDANKDNMDPDEYKSLCDQQKTALQNVLTGYEAIGMAAAQNAVAAVVNAILKAVPGLVGLL